MQLILVTAALMGLIMLGMAVGVIFSNRELKGSCGGVGGNCPCAEAGTPGACAIEPDELVADAPERKARKADDGVLIYE